ncbi:putative tRNA (guanine(10)-N2)-methyltransferase -like isoform 2 [Scophthalmus maximus]|uniref:Putative tRNA (Guanine(10)-N2)-methyltransferase-like isoform 2 n=1 Tax=Scophthalmus maximus TaxID=52904 RepID=A0A2U9AZ65_SCOMX|nr:putative tRNA (guanine(10)-N2)-methyltransferase -like isoform 2 [Scophthalmus maximus]
MATPHGRSCFQYLFHLAQDNLDFRLPEIKSLLALTGKPFQPSGNFKEKAPFWCLDGLCEEDVRGIMARSVCAKSAFELWGHGQTHSELRTSLLKYPSENMSPFMHKESTYRINVYTFNKTLEFTDRIKRIDALEYLPFEGTVSLKSPQHIFCLLEDYGTEPNNIPEHPLYIYFGRWIADGQRELIRSHSVKNRHFIGNTSMDAGLSFLMANHAKVKENDLVFDPFVGTDLLNFSAHHLVMGGRLVYWLPVYSPEYKEEMVPLHPCLQLISNCEQTLSSHTSRRLITMEKIKEPEEFDRLADPSFSPYQGHNAFREKYFNSLNKRCGKEENKSDINGE